MSDQGTAGSLVTLCPCGQGVSRHPGWGDPHEYGPQCCRCCGDIGSVTLESMFRYGLRAARAQYLTPGELAMIDAADLGELMALAAAANMRKLLAATTRFST